MATPEQEAKYPFLKAQPLTCTDGMKYLLARFWYLFESDPVAANRVMVDVRMAEHGHRPPDLIQVSWTTSEQSWREEFVRIRRPYQKNDVTTPEALAEARKRGRPSKAEKQWT